MTTNKVSSESPFYFQLIHLNNIWNIKTVFMQNGYRLQWYGIFPPFLIRYLVQLGLLLLFPESRASTTTKYSPLPLTEADSGATEFRCHQ